MVELSYSNTCAKIVPPALDFLYSKWRVLQITPALQFLETLVDKMMSHSVKYDLQHCFQGQKRTIYSTAWLQIQFNQIVKPGNLAGSDIFNGW